MIVVVPTVEPHSSASVKKFKSRVLIASSVLSVASGYERGNRNMLFCIIYSAALASATTSTHLPTTFKFTSLPLTTPKSDPEVEIIPTVTEGEPENCVSLSDRTKVPYYILPAFKETLIRKELIALSSATFSWNASVRHISSAIGKTKFVPNFWELP